MKKKVLSILLVLCMAAALAGCGNAGDADGNAADKEKEETEAKEEEEITKVGIGVTPYPMYAVLSVAHEAGLDKEYGLDLDLQVVSSTSAGAQSLVRGDVVIGGSCISEHLACVSGSPNLVNFTPLGDFKGFFFVGRKGDLSSWDELVEEKNGDIEAAKEQRLNELKGKTFCIIPQRKALILDALAQVGLAEKDVTFMNFGDDAKAANALLAGTGDFYIGSLPQQRSLMNQGDFINIGGSEILGEAGLWFDTWMTTADFLKNDEETALKLQALIFGAVNAFDSDQDKFSEIAARLFTETSGTETPTEEWKTFMTEFDDLVSVDEARDGFYNPESDRYWEKTVNYTVQTLVESGDLPEGTDGKQYYTAGEELFNKLLENKELVEQIQNTVLP